MTLIDRLEELLALMEAEDDADEEGGEVFALEERMIPADAPEEGGGAAPAKAERLAVLGELEAEAPLRAAGGMAEDNLDPVVELLPAEADVVREEESSRRRAVADRRDGAVEAARRAAELEARRLAAETGEELARAVRHESESALEGLYRRTVQAGRPAPQAAAPEQAGRPRFAEEPGRTAALTVDELDRAVRRDSRRYDGGMTIF